MRRLMYFLLISLVSLTVARADEKPILKSIQIATEEFAPFTSEKLKHLGVISHIVSEAYQLEGINVKYSFYPAARSLMMAKTGILDGTLPWAKRKGREIDFHYSDPVFDMGGGQIFFKKGTKFKWDPKTPDYKNFKGMIVGAIIGAKYGKKFQAAENKGVFQTIRVTSLKQSFHMLLKGRVDIIIAWKWAGKFALQSNFNPAQIAQLDFRSQRDEGPNYDYLLLPKKKPSSLHFLNALNRGLKKLHASGKYAVIVEALNRGDFTLLRREP